MDATGGKRTIKVTDEEVLLMHASGRGGGEGVSLKGSAGDGKALLTRAVGIGQVPAAL
ncbi:MAG: hypothetical protein ACLQME_06590 [Alphaproteobacteria bacterium]